MRIFPGEGKYPSYNTPLLSMGVTVLGGIIIIHLFVSQFDIIMSVFMYYS